TRHPTHGLPHQGSPLGASRTGHGGAIPFRGVGPACPGFPKLRGCSYLWPRNPPRESPNPSSMYKQQLIACQERIRPHIHRTPVFTSKAIDAIAGADIYFKCENLQRMGAFKMRGAVNAVVQLAQDQKQRGVVTHSSGNFAQALSLAARSLGAKAYIVMPENAPQVKKDAVRGYGGEIIECEPTLKAREDEAKRVEERYGARFIHPSN